MIKFSCSNWGRCLFLAAFGVCQPAPAQQAWSNAGRDRESTASIRARLADCDRLERLRRLDREDADRQRLRAIGWDYFLQPPIMRPVEGMCPR